MKETPRQVVVMAQFGLEDYKAQLSDVKSRIKINCLMLEDLNKLETKLHKDIEELEQFLKENNNG